MAETNVEFDWIPFYEEFADKLLAWRDRQGELLAFLEELRASGLKITPLMDKDELGKSSLLTEIDPFTFFGSFNRGTIEETRIKILQAVKARFGVSADVPQHFAGIPILNNQNSWFFAYMPKRKPDDISRLWEIFSEALKPEPLKSPTFAVAFDRALEVRNTNINLTIGLFWIRPRTFLNLDGTMRGYKNIKLPPKGLWISPGLVDSPKSC